MKDHEPKRSWTKIKQLSFVSAWSPSDVLPELHFLCRSCFKQNIQRLKIQKAGQVLINKKAFNLSYPKKLNNWLLNYNMFSISSISDIGTRSICLTSNTAHQLHYWGTWLPCTSMTAENIPSLFTSSFGLLLQLPLVQ